MSPDQLLGTLYAESPFATFPLEQYPARAGGWHSDNTVIDRLVAEARPGLIIEVGTWLGGSAIHMGKLLQAQGKSGRILCIDTWLGAAEFWDSQQDEQRYKALSIRHGFPMVFYQFLANVIHSGLQDTVVPFPQTANNAAVWLAKRKVKAELIYIDGSHEEDDVAADLAHYWDLLAEGGVIFGDDYDAFWPGVIIAVNKFAADRGLQVVQEGGFWTLRKTHAAPAPSKWGPQDELAALRAENAILRAQQTASLARTEEMVSLQVHIENYIQMIKTETARAGFFYEKLERANERLTQNGLQPVSMVPGQV